MGRPLSKKFIGNRNIGTTGTGDNYGIGGEGVASVTANTEGSYTTALPTASFSAPNIPTGVTTTGIVHGHALSAATTSNGTSYRVGDLLTVAGGTKASAATFPVASIITLSTPTLVNGGTNYDATNGTIGDKVTFTHSNFSTPLRVRVTSSTTGTANSITVEQAGVWTGAGAPPTTIQGGQNGFTATTSGGPVDNNGVGMVISFTGEQWGVYSFDTVAVQGDYTVIPASPVSFTGGSGTGATATVPFGVSGIEITEKGSGYVSVADAAITFSGGAASYTPVLTTDSGNVGSGTNQENAIQITAWVPATGAAGNISGNGTSAVAGDIIRQTGNGKYIVRTAQGVGRVKLVAGTPAVGEATIIATDSAGGTYYVTKISDRRCNIVANSGSQFPTNTTVSWTFNDTSGTKVFDEQPYLTANVNVKIANA
jgi:hypothetical protein